MLNLHLKNVERVLEKCSCCIQKNVHIEVAEAATWRFKPNEQNTLAKVNGTNFPSFSVELYSSYTDNHGGLPHGTTVEKLTTAWKQYSITFSLPETTDISFRLLHYQDVPIPGGSLYFANLKLEKGPVATPWSPNPLDILNEIEALKNKIGGVVAHLQTSYMPLEMEAA